LPSPRYLSIHAACCRVAHLSGEYIDKPLGDVESIRVLEWDGSSAGASRYDLIQQVQTD
ncbi:hypothetical protein EDB19DRAFT_1630181, partial [Suillus lakei]